MPAQALPTAIAATPNKPLRIALLGYRSNPYSGGQGVYLKYLSRALVQQGHSVDVISGEPYPDLDAAVGLVKLPGLNLFAAPNHLTALKPKHLLSVTDLFEWASMASGGFPEPFTFGRRLKRYLRINPLRYDIIHDNQSLCHALIQIQDQVPVISTIHHPITSDRDIALSNTVNRGERMLIRRWHNFLKMQIRVAKRLPVILTVSENSKRDLCKDFGLHESKVHIVHNGIDTDDFYPAISSDAQISRNPWQLITTASSDQPLKGTRHLLRAFAHLLPEFPRLSLTIIGKLKTGGYNEKLCEELGVRDKITQRYDLSVEQIRKLYAESAIAVVPSDYEGFGLPAGEAMACGIPLVSTDGGALPEVVGDAGLLVPAKNPEALAGAIKTLLLDTDLATSLSNLGLARVRTHFSWEQTARKTAELYRSHLAQNGQNPGVVRT